MVILICVSTSLRRPCFLNHCRFCRRHPHAVARPDPARPSAVHCRGRHPPAAARALAAAGTRIRSRLGSWIARARRWRSRDRPSGRRRLLARLRRAIGHDHLHPSRSRCAPRVDTCARARRARGTRRGRAADERRRVRHRRGPRNPLGRDRRGVSIRARRIEGIGPGVSAEQEPGVASRRPRPLQPRGEPPR